MEEKIFLKYVWECSNFILSECREKVQIDRKSTVFSVRTVGSSFRSCRTGGRQKGQDPLPVLHE